LSVYFADTSGFAKRYVTETGTRWIRGLCDPASGNVIAVSMLGTVEFLSLLGRHVREAKISASDYRVVRSDFLFHVQRQYTLVQLSLRVVTQAQLMTERYPLRTLDALQLASALVATNFLPDAPIFISADLKLLAAASAEGLPTDDPNAHP